MARLADLKQDKRNARRHTDRNREQIASSIARDGFGRSLLLAADGTIIAGNATAQAAESAGLDDVLVVETDGTKVIAVKRTDVDPDSPEFRRLALADNRAAELAEWDADVLRALGEEVDLADFWQDEDLTALLGPLEETPLTCPNPDALPDDPEPMTQPGDLWLMGNHRLVCGDCSDPAVRERATDGDAVGCLIYDPPWDDLGAPMIPGDFPSILVFTNGRHMGDSVRRFGPPTWLFVWDCQVVAYMTHAQPLNRAKFCLWYGDLRGYHFDGSHYPPPVARKGGKRSTDWGEYTYAPDPRGLHLADVFQTQLTKTVAEHGFGHAKPVDWIRCLIANCSDGVVFDPFAGSGTTALACEQLGRPCRMIELDPAACDLIVDRWQGCTGQAAERVN